MKRAKGAVALGKKNFRPPSGVGGQDVVES